jgi:excisionase family DNA binding protein
MTGIDLTRPHYVAVADAARHIDHDAETLKNWIRQGDLPAYRLGKKLMLRWSDFESFIENRRVKACA